MMYLKIGMLGEVDDDAERKKIAHLPEAQIVIHKVPGVRYQDTVQVYYPEHLDGQIREIWKQ